MSPVDNSGSEQRVDEPRTSATGGSGGDRPPSSVGDGPPHEAPDDNVRLREEAIEHSTVTRDTTPALGTRGEPGLYRRAVEGAAVQLAKRGFADSRWSYIYGADTDYRRSKAKLNGQVPAAAQRMRGGEEIPEVVQGPVMKPAVWTWEIPLYFWIGGIATGSSFIAAACDVVGDTRSASIARKVTLAAIGPAPVLLVMDLGRPGRFLNMLRIFKPRSPMSMGAWCLVGFSLQSGLSVAADILGRRGLAKAFGAGTAVFGTYLGSYTGVLLASTAVPVWARSRLYLAPIFVATAAATGAAANRLVLVAAGTPEGHPTRTALGRIETTAMATELALSHYNEKRLGSLGHSLEQGRPGVLFQGAKWAVRAGLALRLLHRRLPAEHHVASLLYLGAGLAFRYAWVGAGRTSAGDDEEVARTARTPASVVGQERA